MSVTLFALLIEQPRTLDGGVLVELRCEQCDDVHRLALDREQLDAIRTLALATNAVASSRFRPGLTHELLTQEVTQAAADVIGALIWQLTHATAHREMSAREARW